MFSNKTYTTAAMKTVKASKAKALSEGSLIPQGKWKLQRVKAPFHSGSEQGVGGGCGWCWGHRGGCSPSSLLLGQAGCYGAAAPTENTE